MAAALVGYLTSKNPSAAPSGVAPAARVVTIMALIVIGLWAQTDGRQQRMGRLLVLAGFLSCVWLLNGSRVPVLFSMGVLASSLITVLVSYLMLAHPTGKLHSRVERLLIGFVGGVAVASWTIAVLTTGQPPFSTPLVGCAPHCPANELFLGFTSGALPALKFLVAMCWLVIATGVVVLLAGRMRSAAPPTRRSIAPVLVVSAIYMLSVGGYITAKTVAPQLVSRFGIASVAVATVIPFAIALGLIMERLFMGHALEGFVNLLSGAAPPDLETRMASALHDPSLRIAYRRRRFGSYVDVAGKAVAIPTPDSGQEVVEIMRDGDPVAAIIHDAEMSGERPFVQAAGTAAIMWIENARLQADLRASLAELADSRTRLIDAADGERRRIERDLHDGAQQQLVGTRLRLQLVADSIRADPEAAERMLARIGEQVDGTLEELRTMGRGIYPPTLADHGVAEALKSSSQTSPMPVSVRARGVGRYRRDIETAVYFCCLEALQNAAKHAGPLAATTVRLWEQDRRLWLEISDNGEGFARAQGHEGAGLLNMQDRIEAVAGNLTVTSRPGRGTTIRGAVPIA